MKETAIQKLEQKVEFENTGEAVSVQIIFENVSPDRVRLLFGTIDTLFRELRERL